MQTHWSRCWAGGWFIRGLSLTGRLVTCAALNLYLFLAFVSMASAPVCDLKIVAAGLAAVILIDATIIPAMLVPILGGWVAAWGQPLLFLGMRWFDQAFEFRRSTSDQSFVALCRISAVFLFLDVT